MNEEDAGRLYQGEQDAINYYVDSLARFLVKHRPPHHVDEFLLELDREYHRAEAYPYFAESTQRAVFGIHQRLRSRVAHYRKNPQKLD